MTVRERALWLVVGAVLLVAVSYSLFSRQDGGIFPIAKTSAADNSSGEYLNALHMLRTRNVILGRREEATRLRSQLETEFYGLKNPDEAQLMLLREIECLVDETRLNISQKSLVRFKDNNIGVALEGKTGSDAFFRFMERIRTAKVGLKVQRLQIHSLPEERMLNYQLVISTLLIEKKVK